MGRAAHPELTSRWSAYCGYSSRTFFQAQASAPSTSCRVAPSSYSNTAATGSSRGSSLATLPAGRSPPRGDEVQGCLAQPHLAVDVLDAHPFVAHGAAPWSSRSSGESRAATPLQRAFEMRSSSTTPDLVQQDRRPGRVPCVLQNLRTAARASSASALASTALCSESTERILLRALRSARLAASSVSIARQCSILNQ